MEASIGTSPIAKRWERRSTEDVITWLETIEDPRDRPLLQRVSKRRIDFVARCYRELGFSGPSARHRARLAYAAYLGFLHLGREAPKVVSNRADFAGYVEHVIATLVPRRIVRGPK